MTPERIAELRALCEAADDGDYDSARAWSAEARAVLPYALDEIERLRRFFDAYCDFMRATDAEEHRAAAKELAEAREACE